MHIRDHALEDAAEDAASRKRSLRTRMKAEWSGDLVLEPESAEPTIGKVDLHLADERALWGRIANTQPTTSMRMIRWGSIEGQPSCDIKATSRAQP